MALFSLKKIALAARDRGAYLKGIQLYNAGRVTAFSIDENPFYAEFLTASVHGDKGETFAVEAGFDGGGALTYTSCTCDSFRVGEGACRHIVCALTDKYYRDMLGGMTPLSALTPATVRTGESARRLMRVYPKKDTFSFAEPSAPVTLNAALTVSGGRASVSCTVGREKQYIIKNITDFIRAIQREDTVTYGKGFSFCHRPDAFTPASRKLLRFLQGELHTPAGQIAGIGRELPLSEGGVDRFFQLYQDSTVTVKVGGDVGICAVKKADPKLTVSAQKETGGYRFSTSAVTPFYGVKRLYVIHENTLYGCSSAFSKLAGDWLFAVSGEQNGIAVAEEDMSAFCSGVLSVVQKAIPLEEKGELQSFFIDPPKVRIYLDHPAYDTVTAGVQFCYGEQVYPLFSQIRKGEKRDIRAERQVQKLMETYFSGYLPESGEVVFHGDDETLFRFVTEGVPLLEQAGEVFASEAFKKLRPAPPPDIAVGVQMSGDLLQLDMDVSQYDEKELLELFSHFKEHKTFTRLRSGRFVQLTDETLETLSLLWQETGLTAAQLKSGKVTLPCYRALQLVSLLQSRPKVTFTQDAVFRKLAETLQHAAQMPHPVPSFLDTVLRPYQKEGFRWLKTLDEAGFGGILADDMGLGKTLQMISLIAADQQKDLPSLVVCPTSLILNWVSEFRRFSPDISVLAVMGDAGTRERLLEQVNQHQVVITSYDLLKRDILLYKNLKFRYQILDEAQYIKNQRTQNARAVKAVQSVRRFALTGTPIENRLAELWSIFDFLMPGFLQSYAHFKEHFEIPIVRDGDEKKLSRLSKIVGPFLMRRLKAQVLTELPPKTEQILTAEMGDKQRKLYAAYALKAKERIEAEQKAGTFEKRKLSVLTLLMRLRQICCDPTLCAEGVKGDSCKREACMELIKTATAGGHRILLFSQFTAMLEILQKELEKEDISFMTLTGKTPAAQRLEMVDEFNNGDCQVFLISLKAGGTGLNLTGADVVIHYDPWWNVAAQNQATDRAYRIGQQNPVQVVRLITADTVEQRILQLQQAKEHLSDAVLGGSVNSLSSLTAEELLSII